MFRFMVVVYAVSHFGAINGHPITTEVIGDQELLLSFVVNRHGERTPDADELSLSNEQEKLRNLSIVEGLEGLTNLGKRRAYQIGKFIRQRYGSQGYQLLSNLYLQDEIAIRSTDKERTKMTAQIAMAAAYPPEAEQQWDEGVGKVWQPVPYTAIPLAEDYLRYYSNCDKFKELIREAKAQAAREEFARYADLIPTIKRETGRNFTEDPLLFQTLFDLFRSQVSLGLDVPAWARPLLPRLGDAARLAYKIYFRSDEMKRIGGGVLLNNFIEASTKIASGAVVTQRLRLFSAHDFNIGSLMEVTKVKSGPSIPEYGALFALELYRSRSSGRYTVLPLYLTQAGESTARQLYFEGCEADSHCDFDKFRDNTKQFLLPEREYYSICDIKTEL